MSDDLLGLLKSRLTTREPQMAGLRFAAVSVIVRGKAAPSLLLIKRAEHVSDPWSGQISLPGGKAKEGDRALRETAVRETLEEVGIDLASSAEFIGYARPFRTHNGTMDVVPSAFSLTKEVGVRLSEEATSFKWVELKKLVSPGNSSSYPLDTPGGPVNLPAVVVEDYVVWGLTHRILSALLNPETP